MTTPPAGGEAVVPRGSVRRLFGHATIYGLGTLGLQALSAVFTPLLTFFLVPAELGVWSLGMSVFNGLSQIYTLALHGAVTRYYYQHEHQPDEQRRFQGAVSLFLFSWSLGLSIFLFVAGPRLFAKWFPNLPFFPFGALIVAMCLLSVASVVPKAVWQAEERPKALVGIEFGASALSLVGSLLLITLTHIGVLGLFWGRSASLILIAIPCLSYTLKRFGLTWHGASIKLALAFSLPLVPHLLAHWVLAMSDRILIERMLGIGAVGIYASGYAFIESVNLVATSVNRAWVPQFTRAYANEAERPFIARGISFFLFAVLGTATALFVLSPSLIRLAFSEKYRAAAAIAPILAAAGVFQGVYYIYVNGLFFHKQNRLVPIVTVFGGASNVVLNLILIPKMGIAGAAWATLAGYFLLAAGMRWACRRVTRLPFQSLRLIKLAAISLAVGAAALVLDGRFSAWVELGLRLALLGVGALALKSSGFFAEETHTPSA